MENPRTAMGLARPKSKSLKSTIPQQIVWDLELDKGDMVEWDTMTYNGSLIAFFKKVQP